MITKKSAVSKIICILMVCTLIFSLAIPALAGTSKTINTSKANTQTVKIVTGKGWMYSLGLKKTTVKVTNTGKYPVVLYKNIGNIGYSWQGSLYPGQTKTYTAKGSAATYYVKLQREAGKNTTVLVTVSAGSVS